MTNIAIRPATPADVQFLAWSILAATRSHLSRGWFDIALNRPEPDCLDFLQRLAVATARSQWHFSRFLVAESAAGPTAALSAARAADAYPNSTSAIVEALHTFGATQLERESFWTRGAYLFTCTTRPNNDSLVIEVVATLPQHRRQGYLEALLAHALHDGRTRGLKKAEITCFVGNHSAERAYECAGFQFAGEKHHPKFEATAGAAGIRYFCRDL